MVLTLSCWSEVLDASADGVVMVHDASGGGGGGGGGGGEGRESNVAVATVLVSFPVTFAAAISSLYRACKSLSEIIMPAVVALLPWSTENLPWWKGGGGGGTARTLVEPENEALMWTLLHEDWLTSETGDRNSPCPSAGVDIWGGSGSNFALIPIRFSSRTIILAAVSLASGSSSQPSFIKLMIGFRF